MSLTNSRDVGTSTPPSSVNHAPPVFNGLYDTPAGYTDRDMLLEHLDREAFHASKTRDFAASYVTNAKGEQKPRLYRAGSEAFHRCQYVRLTNKQYASVIVIDIDRVGTTGGHPVNLAPDVYATFIALARRNLGPAWLGVNPLSGKAQAIWLIDPVYADKSGRSRHMKLLAATAEVLGEILGHDLHFSHGFSRSPFYTGKDPTAYRWYPQHKRVMRLGDLIREVRDMAGMPQYEAIQPRQEFTSGRELINAVKARREEAQRFKALAQELDAELGDKLDSYDPDLIEGVRVMWIREGQAARDETAFKHALKTGYRLHRAGKRLTDAAVIDAYEHAYTIAQAVGGGGRLNEMPPMRDRLTMARRVRGYVISGGAGSGKHWQGTNNPGRVTNSQRKALSTMGRRGGKKAAERWKTDPEGEYAQAQRKMLSDTRKKRSAVSRVTTYQIAAYFEDTFAQTGGYPTVKEVAGEFSVSTRTVQRALAKTGIVLPVGRKKKNT